MSNNDKSASPSSSQNAFDFYYEKTAGYRSIHADGFVVSPNSKGMIAISFYSERLAIPKHVQLTFDQDDTPVEKVIDGKTGVVRNVDLTTYIDVETAEELREWLGKAISALEDDNDDENKED